MRRRLTTLMCADLVGYSTLMGEDEALAVASVQELRNEHLEPVAKTYGGEVLKRMGDGWILSFPGVEAALDCAEEVQSSLAEHKVIKLRIGCHVGEIVEDEADFYGNGVNITQRIETEAPPGGAMFSEDLVRQLSENRQQELSDVGVFNLKNIATPMRLYQWRPANLTTAPNKGSLPSIGFEDFVAAPATPESSALAQDLHDGMVQMSMKRTGITTVDAASVEGTPTLFLTHGRLRVSGTRARFTVSLILRRDMTTLWTQSYDGDVSDPFAFVDEILPVVSSDLRLQTIQYDGNRLAHLKNSQLSVSELRARAAGLFFKQTVQSWEEGYAALDRAVQLSPTDGMSLAMRAQSRLNLSNIKYEPLSAAALAQIGRDLDLAVAESPNSDFVFWARGAYRLRALQDFQGAAADIEHSRQINPTFLGFVDLITQLALLQGQPQKAIEALSTYSQMTSNDPFRVTRLSFTARVYLAAGDYAMARMTAREAADLRPMDRGLQLLKALTSEKAGDQQGLQEARAAAAALPKEPSIAINQLTLPQDMGWINDALHPQADPV
ncbi:adenylate/guanylate cyclase domain-containing protein [Shimia sp. MMG029]|uniref:adenylate/guanylate cyclase domain-containing protein n=1 Tax=Shimia sp. MMG029 TaxID=3021978 RepID=UPI0022FE899F|nr:adenylate/guanylate cyclase domain-containing protein [Shimia sp. MMG029]MDA5557949.1 adenylate/guanylate cyclase domain-containing protein [Shimia sp. MMG029]